MEVMQEWGEIPVVIVFSGVWPWFMTLSILCNEKTRLLGGFFILLVYLYSLLLYPIDPQAIPSAPLHPVARAIQRHQSLRSAFAS